MRNFVVPSGQHY